MSLHPASCFCCGHGLRHALSRRRFLMAAGGGAAALALSSYDAFAAQSDLCDIKDFVVWCI